MKNYLILYLTVALIFMGVVYFRNLNQTIVLEERVTADCTWLEFMGIRPHYCEDYIWE